MELDWRRLSDAEREREYSPSSCIGGNYQPFIRAYIEQSAAAYRAHPPTTLTYGSAATQTIDMFTPPRVTRPPMLVYFHGGYWQELSKCESAFAVPHALAHGIAVGVVDYTLAPAATLSEIVAECRAAVTRLADRGPLVVAGSSAGAHLAAMVADMPAVRGAVLVSGIYDLEPLIGTSINEALGLDLEEAARNSPLREVRKLRKAFSPSLVCWGDNETDQFKRQSRAFATALREAGNACTDFECAGRNHFDVILDLTDPATALGWQALEFVRSPA